MTRRCSCGAILSRFNHDDTCWPCQEAERRKNGVVHLLAERTADDGPTGNVTGMCMCGCGNPTPLAKKTSSRDGLRKGRPTFYLRGHENKIYGHRNGGRRRLNEQIVRTMRREYRAGGTSFNQLAIKYGLNKATVRDAVNGTTWPHVTDEAA